MLSIERTLAALDPDSRPFQVDRIEPHVDGLADAQPVAVGQQEQRVVAFAVSTAFGRFEQALHLGGIEIVFRPFVGICCALLKIRGRAALSLSRIVRQDRA